MNIFERIHVKCFRRLRDVDLKLKPLNVLIGANGSGKTTLLDVFSLLSASAAGDLKATISEYGGVDSNLTARSPVTKEKPKYVQFNVEKSVRGHAPLKYTIGLMPSGASYEIPHELLTQHSDASKPAPMKYIQSNHASIHYFDPDKNKLLSPEWEHDPLESALSQVPKMYQEPEDFRKGLASSTHYHVLDVSPRAPVRLPQQVREAKLPGKDGEDMVSCLYWMREAEPGSVRDN
jgi:predicted ATPase